VIPARNEEEHIARTVASLRDQTLSPEVIVVVNDGSEDGTGEVAKRLGCVVLDLPSHKESYAGRPELAKVFNAGLAYLKGMDGGFDYILIVGADHPLPPNYVEEVVARMEANPRLVVASGAVEGEPCEESTPRGSGRIVDYGFWAETNGLQYPAEWGWESWLCFKAQSLGYETRCFSDITSKALRPTSLAKAGEWGKAMYALGYHPLYALGRCVLIFFRSPRAGWSMFWSWLLHSGVGRLDVADWVRERQRKRLWKRVKQILRAGARRRLKALAGR